MCFINLVIISFLASTQGLPVQPTSNLLSIVIKQHPKYSYTLLNKTVVPFLEECEQANEKSEIVCGAYFEMVKKLDDSKVEGLESLESFNETMNTYNKDIAVEFCKKFPDLFPKDATAYPESIKLFQIMKDPSRCTAMCLKITTTFDLTVQLYCRVIATGFVIADSSTQKIVKTVNKNTTPTLPKKNNNEPMVEMQGKGITEQKKKKIETPTEQKNDQTKLVSNPNTKVVETLKLTAAEESQDTIDSRKSNVGIEKTLEASVNSKDKSTVIEKSQEHKPAGSTVAEVHEDEEVNPTEVNEIFKTEDENEKSKTEPIQISDDGSIIANMKDQDDSNRNDLSGNDKHSFNEEGNEDNIEKVDDRQVDDDDEESATRPEQHIISTSQFINQRGDVDPFSEVHDSEFFTYFMFLLLVCVIAYVVYHNKTKMLALLLEGRRSNPNGRSSLSRRKHTAAYRKLDSNLEEAITSSANGRSTQVIY